MFWIWNWTTGCLLLGKLHSIPPNFHPMCTYTCKLWLTALGPKNYHFCSELHPGSDLASRCPICWFVHHSFHNRSDEGLILLKWDWKKKTYHSITLETVSKSVECQFGGKFWRGDSRVTLECGKGRVGVARQRPSRNAAHKEGLRVGEEFLSFGRGWPVANVMYFCAYLANIYIFC
jgi:hypothetical protein